MQSGIVTSKREERGHQWRPLRRILVSSRARSYENSGKTSIGSPDRRPGHEPMHKVFCAPARYTQGPRATEQLGTEICALGLEGPAIIVAGGSAIRQLSDTWIKTFAAVEMNYAIFPFGGECTAAEIQRGCQAAREANSRIVIGAGGGKVLDTARAIASDLSLPVVNCPTIASSDAPCSALSVIYTDAGAWEEYRIYRRNPDLVLVDTAVIAKSPARHLIAGMGDALATWFEAKVCAETGAKNMRGGAGRIPSAPDSLRSVDAAFAAPRDDYRRIADNWLASDLSPAGALSSTESCNSLAASGMTMRSHESSCG